MVNQILLSQRDLIIKRCADKKTLVVTLNYSRFEKLENLYKTSVVFSTANNVDNINGFFKLDNDLYIKLLIIHESGRNFSPDIENPYKYKIKVDQLSKTITWSIYEHAFKRVSSTFVTANIKTKFRSSALPGLYSDLVITSDKRNLIQTDKKITDGRDISSLKQKDFAEADRFSYTISPNLDGNRSRNEYFAGSGRNIGWRG
ncbi:hypothetical protein D0469_19320 [Peribacillus saganii]|uniref:Uncharacterized protein n=1 Tax=Peribacillus saganii TaxID=2303992 RepID=A0A372LD98_9BACI|nr:hypothetical protein [Peribacillus saganii]RFU63678.1 hypothetical protein D0469_19320 [Peribacillus saganii]